ncbi:MAG: tetratricopeptide repeat protein [Cyanobacteria bacterium]|nr:tetratricopeptide repeat protein [Cyanobacteriota bacterium]
MPAPSRFKSPKLNDLLRLLPAAFLMILFLLYWFSLDICIFMSALSWKNKQFVQSMNYLNTAVRLNPRSGKAYYSRAYNKVLRKKRRESIDDYTTALKLGYDKTSCYVGRGFVYHLAGDFDRAREDYSQCLNEDPDNTVALSNMGDVCFRYGKLDLSLDYCNRSIDADPLNSVAIANRAQVWLRKGQYDRCMADITRAIELSEDRPDKTTNSSLMFFYLIKASASRAAGNNAEAEKAILAARKLHVVKHAKQADCTKLEKRFSQKITRPGFVLCTDLSPDSARSLADNIEGFLKYIDQNLCKVKFDSDVHLFVWNNPEKFRQFARANNRTTALYGWYSPSYNAVFSYSNSGFGTLTHELMRKVVESIPFMDEWAKEGIPSLFEKIFGYREGDQLRLALGAQNPWRIEALSKRLKKLDLRSIIAEQWPALTVSEERLAAIFLLKNGFLRRYLELSENGEIGDYATIFEATFEKRVDELVPEWQSYLNHIHQAEPTIRKLPISTIFKSKEEFDRFEATFADCF